MIIAVGPCFELPACLMAMYEVWCLSARCLIHTPPPWLASSSRWHFKERCPRLDIAILKVKYDIANFYTKKNKKK